MSAPEQFREVIQAAGLTPPDSIEPDGKLHRFASNGKRGDDAGWYVLHVDGIAAGAFGDWRSDVVQTWRADIQRTLTRAEEAAHRAKQDAMRKQREADKAQREAEAAEQAGAIWQAAKPAGESHPYLQRKGIKPYGAREQGGRLVIPMFDAAGKLWNVERISPETPVDGGTDKKGLFGGKRTGCYFRIGTMKGAVALVICEGYATGASIHDATGYPVAGAFNAGNLEAVARELRKKFPELTLILCADDDAATEGNPGLTKARAAARAVGALLAIPDFGSARPAGATDFNDMARLCGVEAVARAVTGVMVSAVGEPAPGAAGSPGGDPARLGAHPPGQRASDTDVTAVTTVQAGNDGPSSVTAGAAADATDVTGEGAAVIPDAEHRPAFVVLDAGLTLPDGGKLKPGVWYFGIRPGKNADDAPALTQQWICSPLHVEAVTFDAQDNNFGRLLRFKNTLGRWREWAMPMELLRGAGDELRGELLAMGVAINSHAKNLLAQYLQANTPTRRVHCALQVGWCGDSFVLPDAVIGPRASAVIFQSGERGHEEHVQAGTLTGWQSGVAARAVGNPLLLLALSASFAGPMLQRCNAESGGIHFFGDSSTGKTTMIEAGCSTWGGPNFRRSWRATANGMEGAAAMFNDCLLALDEISECDPREVGAVVYMLGNGRGKQRANRTGNARGVTRWRCVVLSSGERTIGTHMAEGGHRAKAGHSVRLLDVPAARRVGAFDDLHGMPSGTAFADAIKRAAAAHYGHAGRAFLEKLTRDERDFCALLERIQALPEFSAEGGEGQDKRGAARFALLALAGELATEYGITGWAEGAAVEAAAEGFQTWRSMRGPGNDERRQVLERVSGFIEKHGDSRFSDADRDAETAVRDRAGWWRDDSSNGRLYLFNADGLREALKGFDFRRALDTLQEVGALPKLEAGGERAKPVRIGRRPPVRLYPIQAAKLECDRGA